MFSHWIFHLHKEDRSYCKLLLSVFVIFGESHDFTLCLSVIFKWFLIFVMLNRFFCTQNDTFFPEVCIFVRPFSKPNHNTVVLLNCSHNFTCRSIWPCKKKIIKQNLEPQSNHWIIRWSFGSQGSFHNLYWFEIHFLTRERLRCR